MLCTFLFFFSLGCRGFGLIELVQNARTLCLYSYYGVRYSDHSDHPDQLPSRRWSAQGRSDRQHEGALSVCARSLVAFEGFHIYPRIEGAFVATCDRPFCSRLHSYAWPDGKQLHNTPYGVCIVVVPVSSKSLRKCRVCNQIWGTEEWFRRLLHSGFSILRRYACHGTTPWLLRKAIRQGPQRRDR